MTIDQRLEAEEMAAAWLKKPDRESPPFEERTTDPYDAKRPAICHRQTHESTNWDVAPMIQLEGYQLS